MKNFIKKGVTFAGVAVGSLSSVFAEGAAPIVNATDMEAIFTSAQSNMGSLISAALPVVIAFVSGGLIIWGGLALVSLLKRGFGAGKGR